MPTPEPANRPPRNKYVLERFQNLAITLAELKVKLRSALATELAGAIGTAVRDVLVVGMVDRLIAGPHARNDQSHPRPVNCRAEEYEGRWESRTDPWTDDFTSRDGYLRTSLESGKREVDLIPATPTASTVAVGVQLGRWWLARQGTVPTAIGLGIFATALGFIGGPVARTALAVIATVSDLFAAESALVSHSHS